jgi:hypothetical protein
MVNAPANAAVVFVRWRDLKCFPEKLLIRQQEQGILWVTDGDGIEIDAIPGLTVDNDGTYATADPAPGTIPDRKYSGTLTKGGQQPKRFDPRLEVVR